MAAQYENQTLVKIEGVNTTKDAEFYYGKRVAYVYKVSLYSNRFIFVVLIIL